MNKHTMAIARAVAVIGATTAVIVGITFAQIPSNTVQLSNDTLTSATATLGIGVTSTCTDQGLGPVQGMDFTNLLPTVASSPFTFCLDNTGNTPLALTASTDTVFTGSAVSPNDVTLNVTCGVGGSTTGAVAFTSTVGGLATPQAFDNSLTDTTNNVLSCQMTATMDANVVTSNASLTPFNVNFVGSTINGG